jgi:Fe-S cluster biogenesis protein NfuA/nitrite reductase/ring-hydroxylating ferredoxin subunit
VAEDVGERVETLLLQVRRQGGEPAAATAEELVRALVDYYGSGLERIVEVIGAKSPELVEVLADDPLVESQLILHGLHPIDTDVRIERALDRVRPYLGSHAGGVAFLGVDDEGVAHLRLDGSCHGCPSSTITVRMTIEEAVLGAAPEVSSVEVEGQTEEPKPLLQIGRRPGASGPAWRHPSRAELPEVGRSARVRLEGQLVLMCRVGETYYAYVDTCPSCGGSVAGGALDGDVLACASCAARFDVRLAGRSLDGTGRHLSALPLLDDVSGIRVALPEAV